MAATFEAKPSGVEEVHVLWISEGMSCDGDSVSITAAGQPGIEDVLLGAIPGLPKVHLHNKVLSPTLGGEELLVESLELEEAMTTEGMAHGC
jgi:hydrogenase small subunit